MQSQDQQTFQKGTESAYVNNESRILLCCIFLGFVGFLIEILLKCFNKENVLAFRLKEKQAVGQMWPVGTQSVDPGSHVVSDKKCNEDK